MPITSAVLSENSIGASGGCRRSINGTWQLSGNAWMSQIARNLTDAEEALPGP